MEDSHEDDDGKVGSNVIWLKRLPRRIMDTCFFSLALSGDRRKGRAQDRNAASRKRTRTRTPSAPLDRAGSSVVGHVPEERERDKNIDL